MGKTTADKLATVFGTIASVSTAATGAGMTLGHFGHTNFLPLISAVFGAAWAWVTNKNVGSTSN